MAGFLFKLFYNCPERVVKICCYSSLNFIGLGYGIVSWTSKTPEKENNVK
jgi:hypothetical protein